MRLIVFTTIFGLALSTTQLAVYSNSASSQSLDNLPFYLSEKDKPKPDAPEEKPQKEEKIFSIVGWNSWLDKPGKPDEKLSFTVTPVQGKQEVSFNGSFPNHAAGYATESKQKLPSGEQILTLSIEGAKNCKFMSGKMFKIKANGQAIEPRESSRKTPGDTRYVRGGDGTVSFELPPDLKNLEFVFWNAELKDLKISGKLTPKSKK